MTVLSNLTTEPFNIENDELDGCFYVKGNIEENTIKFLFEFKNPENLIPLKVSYSANQKTYSCLLSHFDKSKAIVESYVFDPSFSLKDRFFVTKVEPLAEIDI